MQLGTVLRLGDFEFPLSPKESLDFDMKRSLAKLDFPGGPPIYQDMGMDEKKLDFSGSFIGNDALLFSDKIESLWWAGEELQLSYGDINKQVRIESYKPKLKRTDRVDYSINLIVCYPQNQLAEAAEQGDLPRLVDAEGSIEEVFDQTYTIRAGDTLWQIAARSDVFGDGSKWESLAAVNGITDEYSLQVGQVIKLPSSGNAWRADEIQQRVYASAVGEEGYEELQNIMEGVT